MGITIFLLYMILIPCVNPLSFDFQTFNSGKFKLEGDATLSPSEIQLTKTSIYVKNTNSVGRVTYFEPLQLWDNKTGNLTDFTTKFSFVIYTNDKYYADGLAFFLADPNLPAPIPGEVQQGGGLGIVDGDQVWYSTKHQFVAVEFDTHANDWDPHPHYHHVGINFNSMKSNITKHWSIDVKNWRIYDSTIQYNATSHNLSVSFTGFVNGTNGKVVKGKLSYIVDLRDCLPEKVIFGFSAATGIMFELNILKSWSFNSTLETNENFSGKKPTPIRNPTPSPITNPTPSPITSPTPSPITNPTPSPILTPKNSLKQDINKKGSKVGIGFGIGVPASFLIFGLVCVLMWKRAKGKKEDSRSELEMMDHEFPTGPKRYPYKELASATSNFAEANKIGQGGFGCVYKGFLKDINSNVAIKRISRESKQGIKEYATEVKIISQLRHRNLVQLIGWCHRKKDLLLVYEFMQNGSIDCHLYRGRSVLTSEMRYNIAMDLALAILYLHEEWKQCVLHRDIKSSNIMLDSSFYAKLGDFGLARLVDHEKGSQTTILAGTRGYIAPEYFTTGKAKKESDIYSFGIVSLELASGRKPIDLKAKDGEITIFEWVWELYRLGRILEAVDSKLEGEFDEDKMERLVIVGLWCANPDFLSRPSIRHVIQVLKFEAPLPVLPQKMLDESNYIPVTMSTIFDSVSSAASPVTC